MIKYIANILTGCRIFGSILLLFFSAYSTWFYSIYVICGLTDMVDGTIAKMTSSESEFGSKLDTAADLAFITVSLIKILPTVNFPIWVWAWGAVIAIIKIGNIILGYACKKHLLSLHTVPNKITGLLLFLLPFTFSLVELKYSSIIVCSMATFAAVHEWVYAIANCESK